MPELHPGPDFTYQIYEDTIGNPPSTDLSDLSAIPPLQYNSSTYVLNDTPASWTEGGYLTQQKPTYQQVPGYKRFEDEIEIQRSGAAGALKIYQTTGDDYCHIQNDITDGVIELLASNGTVAAGGKKACYFEVVTGGTGNVYFRNIGSGHTFLESLNGACYIGCGATSTSDTEINNQGTGKIIIKTASGDVEVRSDNFYIRDIGLNKYVQFAYNVAGEFRLFSDGDFLIYPPLFTKSQVEFQNYAPLCSTAPTLGNHLVNKTYADSLNGTKPYAEMYMQDNSTATSSIVTGVPMKMAGTTTAGSLYQFTHPTSNRLTYGGSTAKLFHLQASGSWLFDDSTSQELAAVMFYMYDNSGASGAVIAKSKLTTKLDNDGDCPSSFSLDCLTTLDTSDYIEVWVERIGANDDEIIVRGINVVIALVQ